MGLASKMQASGSRPAAGGPPQPAAGAPMQQSSYGQQQQQQQQPPYPVPQAGGQSQYGAPTPQANTRPTGYSANQPSSNPYAQAQPGQQSQYGAPQQQSSYGQPPQQQSSYGQPSQQQSQFGAPQGQYGALQQQPPGQQYPPPGKQQQQQHQAGPGQYGQPGPQGQYGAAPQGGQQFGGPPQGQQAPVASSGSAIRDNLTRIIRENHLEVFYPAQRLQQVIQKVEAIDFRSLASTWEIPMEIATDLASLALYDVVLYCDDSGSMRAEERGERIEDLKLILSKVAEVATLFDDDGIQVRFMNSDVQGNGIRTASAAAQLIEQVRFSGITPLATQLDRKVIQPLVLQQIRSRSLQKPVLVVVITDGEPVGEPRDLTRRVIAGSTQQAAQQGFPGAVRFQFAQVGKDMKAQTFLGELDNDKQIGGVIDAISYFELEAEEFERKNGMQLTPDLWLVKLCVGAIDASYDEQDE